MLEEDDKLVTKTEDASMGIHESIEDERPLAESGETTESDQDLLKESHDKEEVDKAVEEDIKKEEPVIQDRNLGSVEGKILRERRSSFRLPGKVANVGKKRTFGKRVSPGGGSCRDRNSHRQ